MYSYDTIHWNILYVEGSSNECEMYNYNLSLMELKLGSMQKPSGTKTTYTCCCCLENAHCQEEIASLTPGTHLGGRKSSENWCHWTAGRLFTKNSLSDGNRDKLKGKKRTLCSALCWILTEFKTCMNSKSGL